MNKDFVTCAICSKQMASINNKHLLKHNLTLTEYKEQFPNHPVFSESSIQKMKERSALSNASRKGVKRAPDVIQKIKDTKQQNPKPAWNKGIPKTQEQKDHLSDIRKELFETGSITHWNKGKSWSDDVKQQISDTALSQHRSYSETSKYKRQLTIDQKKQEGWVHHSSQRFINSLTSENLDKFNDKDWLYTQHITNKRTLASICIELGLHWKNSTKTIKNQLIYFDIPIQYWHQTSSIQQLDLETFLLDLNVNIVTRNRTIISPYELDIYLPEYNIAIEYCGLYWHSTEYKSNNYHKMKYDMCKQQGIRLLTIYSDEWLNNRLLVENKIKHIIGHNNNVKIHGRQCVIVHTEFNIKKPFFDTYHIQGDGPGSVTYHLEYNNEVVAMITFINQGNGRFVLNRYATKYNIRGGFNKLLSHFKRNHTWTSILTFADLRWSTGDLYSQNGFTLDKVLPPDYQYVVDEERIHKFNFRHKNLHKRLENYDKNLSETQNTIKHQIYRIFNCGLQRWIMINH